MDQKIFLYKYSFFSFRNPYFKSRRFCETKLNPSFSLAKYFVLRTNTSTNTNLRFVRSFVLVKGHRVQSEALQGDLLKFLFLYHEHKKLKDTHFAPINFVHKRANTIRAVFSYVEKRSIKSISRQSKYKVNVSKKNILQIINQSRESITIKQLLVSLPNLIITQSLSRTKRSYKSSYFRWLYPWGLQISDWHHRIQIKDLYPVTGDFPQRNQKFCKAKLNCYKVSRFVLRRKKFVFRGSIFAAIPIPPYKLEICMGVGERKWKTLLLVLQSKTIFFVCIPDPLCIRFTSALTLSTSRIEAERKEKRKTKKPRLYKSSYMRNPQNGSVIALYRSFYKDVPRAPVGKIKYIQNKRLCTCSQSFVKRFVRARTCSCNPPEEKSRLTFAKRAIVNRKPKYSFCLAKKRQKNENNVILSISGGQDSSFLLFCLSFLQFQIAFKAHIIWCNHFWQKSSFYTTRHLTKSAMAFSAPIMGFLPFHMSTSPQLYEIVRTSFYSVSLQRKKKQSKTSVFCKNFLKKQDKNNLYTKNNFYVAKRRKKGFKAYKKFIKEISETRARNWRHITIERACTFSGSRLCLNGHTLSDRVETILFNLIRGTKKKDFQALPWKRRHSTFCYNRFYPTLEQVIKYTHIHFI